MRFCNIDFNIKNRTELFEYHGKIKIINPTAAGNITVANKEKRYYDFLNKTHVCFDGQVPCVAARLLHRGCNYEKLSGSDLIYEFCEFAKEKGYRVFFLGGEKSSNEKAVNYAHDTYNIDIEGFSPHFEKYPYSNTFNELCMNVINRFKPDILFLGFGYPKQEYFIEDNWEDLMKQNIKFIIPCGGSIDFMSNKVKRAPKYIQRLGLESVYRLIQEPDKERLLGMGRMGLTHYAIINNHPDIEIEAVADPSPLMLAMLRKHVPVKTFKDYNEMLEETRSDLVLVCTPPHLNFDIVRKTAEKGMSAFVEKPFVAQSRQAAELTKVYAVKGLVNQVGYVNRFNDVFLKTKELLNDNVIGNVIRFKSEMFSCTVIKSDEKSGWRASRESGGGAVFEMASHAIDLVNYLVGKPDKVTGSSLDYIYSTKVEDAACSTFLYKNGVSGTLNVNWSDTSYRKPANKIEIFGDGGRILADQYSLKMFLNRENKGCHFRQGWNTLYITDIFTPVPFYVRGNEFTRQLYHFVDCVQKKTDTQCTFNDGTNVLEVIDAIFRDYEQNGRI
jgi:exopolysaccharide biosynthesis WecB/TagA/CpsF family protein